MSALRLGVVELPFNKVALDLVGGGLVVLAGVASAVAVVGVVVALVASLGRTGLRRVLLGRLRGLGLRLPSDLGSYGVSGRG